MVVIVTNAVTVRIRHSFVALPEPSVEMRTYADGVAATPAISEFGGGLAWILGALVPLASAAVGIAGVLTEALR